MSNSFVPSQSGGDVLRACVDGEPWHPAALPGKQVRVLGSYWTFSVVFQTVDGHPIDMTGLTPGAEILPGNGGSAISLGSALSVVGNQAIFGFDSANSGIITQDHLFALNFPVRFHAFLVDQSSHRTADVIVPVVAVDPKSVDISTLPDASQLVAVCGPRGPAGGKGDPGDITPAAEDALQEITGLSAQVDADASDASQAAIDAAAARDVAVPAAQTATTEAGLATAAAQTATDRAASALTSLNGSVSAATLSQGWASTPANTDVPGAAGGSRSSLHYSGQASASAASALTYLNGSISAASLAAAWAATADNTDVPGAPAGSRSAKHWSDWAFNAASTAVAQAKVPIFSSFASVAALTLAGFLATGMVFDTQGYANPNDGGGARYEIVSTLPTGPNAARYSGTSSDGVKFRYQKTSLPQMARLEQFGGKADGSVVTPTNFTGTDNKLALTAFQEFTSYSPSDGSANIPSTPLLLLGDGSYYFSTGIDNKFVSYWTGTCAGKFTYGNRTRFLFPAGVIGITNNNFNTAGGTVTSNTTSAVGSVYTGIEFQSACNGVYDGSSHGFWGRSIFILDRCVFSGWGGNGLHNVASTGGSGALYGLTNGSRASFCLARNIGGHGFYSQGSDANACTFVGLQALAPIGLCGIKDDSQFGNHYFGCEVDGYDSKLRGRADANGNRYYLINDTPGIGATTPPGTDDTVWRSQGASAQTLPWSSSNTYQVSMPIWCSGASIFVGCYTEGGTSYLGNSGIGIGGTWGADQDSAFPIKAVGSYGTAVMWQGGVGGLSKYASPNLYVGNIFDTYSGSKVVPGSALGWSSGIDGSTRWNLQYRYGDTALMRGSFDLGTIPIISFTGAKNSTSDPTRQHANKTSFFDNGVIISKLAIGAGDGNQANTRQVSYASGNPQTALTGDFAQGEIRFAQSGAPSGTWGWYCTTAGALVNNGATWTANAARLVDDVIATGGNLYLCTTRGKSGPTTAPSGTTTFAEGVVATMGKWATATNYTAGDTVYTTSGVYSAGTTATSGTVAPSGTTTSNDGTITWTYVGALAATKGTFLRGTTYAAGDTVYTDSGVYSAGGSGVAGPMTPTGTTTSNDGVIAWTYLGPAGAVWLYRPSAVWKAMGTLAP